jgi:signal transduction histidine kinase
MRLANFILENVEPILQQWEDFARSLEPGAKMDTLALRDDAEAILRACARDMRTAQSGDEQVSKSRGLGGAGGAASDRLDDASAVHGVGRVGSGFNLNDVVSEYRALRASVLNLWRKSTPNLGPEDLADAMRFNEAIDQSLGQAVASYTHRVDQSRRMFLAILSHDLRNPLNCIRMSARVASIRSEADPECGQALRQIDSSVQAIARLITDLLEFAAAGIGEGIPIAAGPVDFERLGREVVNEFARAHPQRGIRMEARGELACWADGARLRQVVSNLLANALDHGAAGADVEVLISSGESEITLRVRNQGRPIPRELLPTIFDPLVRDLSSEAQQRRRAGSIGLGLFIAREIITAHGGSIEVTSSAEAGTEFTVRFPHRRAEIAAQSA